MKFNKNEKEFLKQMNEAIKHSEGYANGMAAMLIGNTGIAISKDGERLNTPQAQLVISHALNEFFNKLELK